MTESPIKTIKWKKVTEKQIWFYSYEYNNTILYKMVTKLQGYKVLIG